METFHPLGPASCDPQKPKVDPSCSNFFVSWELQSISVRRVIRVYRNTDKIRKISEKVGKEISNISKMRNETASFLEVKSWRAGAPVGRQKPFRDQENPQNVKVPGSSNGCYMDDNGCQYKISLCVQRDPARYVLEDVCWPRFGSRPGCAMYQRYL